MKIVGIIGGAGFIGSHITRKFLEKNYKVKVSVTNIQKSEKYEHLFSLENSININIRPLKLENGEALGNFIEDCQMVIHSGTPFQLEIENPQAELLDPTINGTRNFLDSLLDAPQLKKVIFIASVAAWNTNFPLPAGGKNFLKSFDERDERFTCEDSHPYCRAKFVANSLVEQFIEDNPDLPFEITTVSPVMVIGKALSKREDSTSTGIQSSIKKKLAPDDFFQGLYDNNVPLAMVDVEDVAQAVYNAATTTGLHGKDYILTSETYKVLDIHEMLNRREPKEKAQVVYKNNLAKKDLNLKFRPVRKTLYAWQNPG